MGIHSEEIVWKKCVYENIILIFVIILLEYTKYIKINIC